MGSALPGLSNTGELCGGGAVGVGRTNANPRVVNAVAVVSCVDVMVTKTVWVWETVSVSVTWTEEVVTAVWVTSTVVVSVSSIVAYDVKYSVIVVSTLLTMRF